MPKSKCGEKVNKMTPRTAAVVGAEIRELLNSYAEMSGRPEGMKGGTLTFWSSELTRLIEEIRPLLGPEGADILGEIEDHRNHWVACSFASKVTKNQREYDRLAHRLAGATRPQLAALYERITHARQLGGGQATLLLDAGLEAVTTMADQHTPRT